MQRRTRRWTTQLAMAAGLMLGLWLLTTLRVEAPKVRPTSTVIATPAAPPARPAVRTAPQLPHHPAPALAPLPEDEAYIEPEVDTAEPEPALVSVFLRTEDARGRPVDGAGIRVMGCEIVDRTSHEDSLEIVVEEGSFCTADAFRADGLLRARADRIEFEAESDTEVTLVFPAERTGGIGVQFRPVDDGIVVVMVMPGTPAYQAGLQPGDRILSVGGIPTVDLDAQDFVAEMTGPEGSDVEFEVAFEADTGLTISTVTLTREFLSG